MGPIRILHIITQLSTGGAELQLLNLCSKLPRDRFSCRVVSLVAGGNLIPRFEAAGIPVTALDRREHGGPVGQMLALMREIRRAEPDVVHTWLQKANHVGRIAATLATTKPLIASVRDLGFMAGRGDTLLDSLFEGRTALTLHNSEAGRRAYFARVRLAWRRRHELLPNGIDTERFSPQPEARKRLRAEQGLKDDDPVIIMVARLHPIKDPRLFIATARRARRDLPAARFWLAGGGPLEAELRRDLAADPDPGIWLSGERQDVPALMAAADVALSTSRSEGLSNTILEAMSCGLPVLATDVGGNRELIEDGVTGALLRERDAGSIAADLTRLLALPDKRRDMGLAGRRRVEERFSLDRLAENAAGHYQRICRGRHRHER